ncbi:hypothetical protein GCM10023075_46740 [Streptosporangium album]
MVDPERAGRHGVGRGTWRIAWRGVRHAPWRVREWRAAQSEAPPRRHACVDLRGGGLVPQVAGPVRQGGRVVGVRRMAAPPAPERGRGLFGMPTDPDDPGSSVKVVHGSHLQCAIKALPGDSPRLVEPFLCGVIGHVRTVAG